MEQNRRDFLKLWGKVTAGVGAASMAGALPRSAAAAEEAMDGDSGANAYWKQVRNQAFSLQNDRIYMNNSTLGPTLTAVASRMKEVQKIFSAGCTLDDFFNLILTGLAPMRNAMQTAVGATWDGNTTGKWVGNVDSATDGMSLVANGLTFGPGDVIIITDHEHAGARVMWELQRDRYGATVVMVPLVGAEPVDQWREAFLDRVEQAFIANAGHVKALSFPWVTTSTGHLLPAKDLCSMAKTYGAASVIDAAQSFTILAANLVDIDADFVVMNGHKYLCGPVGSGFIIINKRQLDPTQTQPPGRNFFATIVDDSYYFPGIARNYPHRKGGIQAYTNILPLREALEHYLTLGPSNVEARLLQIGTAVRNWLAAFPEYFELVTPRTPGDSCIMTCFKVRGVDSETVYQRLKNEFGIQVKHSSEGGADTVRIAPHYYNVKREFKALGEALATISGLYTSEKLVI